MNVFFLGCDVSKGYCDFVLLDKRRKQTEPVFQLDDTAEGHRRICTFLDSVRKGDKDALIYVGMESTGGYENNWLVLFKRISQEYNLKVTRVDPLAVKRYREACKVRIVTDAISAYVIAHFLGAFHEELNFEQDYEFESLRRQWNQAQLFVKLKTQLTNQLSFSIYQSHPELVKHCRDGIPNWVLQLLQKYPTASQLARARAETVAKIPFVTLERARNLIREAKDGTASAVAPVDVEIMKRGVEQIISLEQTISLQKKQIVSGAKAKEIHLLASIAGIGEYSAAGLMTCIIAINRFAGAKSLSAFFGLHPVFKESGDGRSIPRMSKCGHSQPRAILYMCVLSAITCNPVIQKVYERCIARKMAPKAAIGVCMHKMTRIIYGVLASGKPFDPNIDQMNQNRSRKQKKESSDEKRRMQPFDSAAPVSRRQNRSRAEKAGREGKPQRNSVPKCGVYAPLPATETKMNQHRTASVKCDPVPIGAIVNSFVEV